MNRPSPWSSSACTTRILHFGHAALAMSTSSAVSPVQSSFAGASCGSGDVWPLWLTIFRQPFAVVHARQPVLPSDMSRGRSRGSRTRTHRRSRSSRSDRRWCRARTRPRDRRHRCLVAPRSRRRPRRRLFVRARSSASVRCKPPRSTEPQWTEPDRCTRRAAACTTRSNVLPHDARAFITVRATTCSRASAASSCTLVHDFS